MKAKLRDREFEIEKVGSSDGYLYDLSDVELLDAPDYWENLKHQAAVSAMQGMLSNAVGFDEVRKQAAENGIDNLITLITGAAIDYATALVEKLKEDSKC